MSTTAVDEGASTLRLSFALTRADGVVVVLLPSDMMPVEALVQFRGLRVRVVGQVVDAGPDRPPVLRVTMVELLAAPGP